MSKRSLLENKVCQIFQKTSIPYPLIRTHMDAYQRVRNFSFLENMVCCFLVTIVRRFMLLPYYQQNSLKLNQTNHETENWDTLECTPCHKTNAIDSHPQMCFHIDFYLSLWWASTNLSNPCRFKVRHKYWPI